MPTWVQGATHQVTSSGLTWVQYGTRCKSFAGELHIAENPWVTALPTGDPGDFLLAFVMNNGGATPTTHPPTGWNLAEGGTFSNSPDNYRTHLYWRQRQAGDSTLTVNYAANRSGFVTILNAESDLNGDDLGGNSYNEGVDQGGTPNPFNFDDEQGPYVLEGRMFFAYFQWSGNILQQPAAPWVLRVNNDSTINQCALWTWTGDPGDTVPDFTFEVDDYIELFLGFDLSHVCTD